MKKYKKGLFQKVVVRTLKLFVLGLLTQGGGFPSPNKGGFDLYKIRIPGILQRIAWAYFVVACMAMGLPKLSAEPWLSHGVLKHFHMFRVYAVHWLVALSFFALYAGLFIGLPAPDYSFTYKLERGPEHVPEGCVAYTDALDNSLHANCTVACNGTSGDFTPACSALRTVDLALLGRSHMYDAGPYERLPQCSGCSPWKCPLPQNVTEPAWCHSRLDPEGVLSSLNTVLTTWLGLFLGNVLVHYTDHVARLRMWSCLAVSWFVLGLVIDAAGWHINKQTWSPSYVFMMSGACGFFVIFFYILLDWQAWQPSWLKRARTCLPVIFDNGTKWTFTDVFMPLVWVGRNTIFIYLMSPSGSTFESIQRYFYLGSPENTILGATRNELFCADPVCPIPNTTANVPGCPDHTCGEMCTYMTCSTGLSAGLDVCQSEVFLTIMRITAWVGVAGILHWRGWFWAL